MVLRKGNGALQQMMTSRLVPCIGPVSHATWGAVRGSNAADSYCHATCSCSFKGQLVALEDLQLTDVMLRPLLLASRLCLVGLIWTLHLRPSQSACQQQHPPPQPHPQAAVVLLWPLTALEAAATLSGMTQPKTMTKGMT